MPHPQHYLIPSPCLSLLSVDSSSNILYNLLIIFNVYENGISMNLISFSILLIGLQDSLVQSGHSINICWIHYLIWEQTYFLNKHTFCFGMELDTLPPWPPKSFYIYTSLCTRDSACVFQWEVGTADSLQANLPERELSSHRAPAWWLCMLILEGCWGDRSGLEGTVFAFYCYNHEAQPLCWGKAWCFSLIQLKNLHVSRLGSFRRVWCWLC